MSAPAGVDDRIIERDDELAQLRDFLADVRDGPAFMLLDGEAGIGKSTLWREAVASAEGQSYGVLSCRPAASERRLSFSALGDLLGPVLDEALPALPPPQARALEVALLRVEPEGPPPDHRAVSVAALAAVRGLAVARPLLIATDDVQWLDPPSARILEYVIRRLFAERVGVLACRRTDARDRSAPLGLSEAEVPLRRLRLGPLTLAACHHLVRSRVGSNLPRSTLVQLHEASAGNPFFAIELARGLVETGAPLPSGRPLPVPEDIGELLNARLAAIPPEAMERLLVVSAMSHPTVPLVEAALRGAKDAGSWTHAGVEAGVIELVGREIRFTHPLYANTIYWAAEPSRRRAVHRRVAGVVGDAEERARHLALGADGPDATVASAVDLAARKAGARGAPDAAAELMEQARELSPPADVPEILRRDVEAASYHFDAGNTARAGDLLEQAVEALPLGPVRAEALRLLGQVRRRDGSCPAAVTLAERALEEAGENPELELAIELDLALASMLTGNLPSAAEHARGAVELAGKTGDTNRLGGAEAALASFEFLLGRGISPTLERAVRIVDRDEDLPVELRPGVVQGLLLSWTGDYERARRELVGARHRVLERGEEGGLPFLSIHLAQLECWAGNWELARRYADEGYEIALQTGQEVQRGFILYARALVDALVGRVEPARDCAQAGLAICQGAGAIPGVIWNLSALGFLELSLGNVEGTHAYLGDVAGQVVAIGLAEPGVVRFMPDEVEALIALGELDAAESFLRPFEERGRALDRPWVLATAARCRGLLNAARGDLVAAAEVLDRALGHHERVAQPFELGRTLLVRGELERRAKQKRAARVYLERAVGIFERLGAPLWSRRARDELARVGGRPPSSPALTPTELQVAEAAAVGLTNRQVADRLFLSVHTVSDNLKRAYRKLGIGNRTELAGALSARRGGAGEPAPTDRSN